METKTLSPSLPPLVSFHDDLDLDDDTDLVVDNPLSHGCQPRRRTSSSYSSLVVSEWLRILSGNKDDPQLHPFSSSNSNHSSSSSCRWATDKTFTTINTTKATTAPLHLPIRHKSPTIHVHRKKPTTINGEPQGGPVPCPVRKVSLVPGDVEENSSSAATIPPQEQERLLVSLPKPRRAWMSSATSDLLLQYPMIDDEEEDEEEDENDEYCNICDNELPSGSRSASHRSTMVWRSTIPSTTATASEKIPTRSLYRFYKRSLSRTLLSDEPSSKPKQLLKRHGPKKNIGGLFDHRSPPLQPTRQLSKNQ